MRPIVARYTTACQQLLALGAVLAVLTPAAAVISLDVVQETPAGEALGGRPAVGLSAYVKETKHASTVPTAPVDAHVTEIPMTASAGTSGSTTGGKTGSLSGRQIEAKTKIGALGEPTSVTSAPEPVTGYGAVGVTWDRTRVVPDDLAFEARWLEDGVWSDWTTLPYDADHGPDPDTQEAENSRPGTDVLLVGKVDEVQVRSTMESGTTPPAGMKLAVVAPGKETQTARELPALDTNTGDEATTVASASADAEGASPESADGQDGLALQAAVFTPKPVIYSRAQWGANENLRDKPSLHYYEVHAGFVHHTVNANDYSRREVPGIIRSIYAYHTQSRGWSDVGYNFLVDKFGRIWEGRYGGIDRPVVGAHTLGYNDYAFAMSAIGNYEVKRPSEATVQAYGALFAWKLSLHGVDASSTKQWVGSKFFQAINGHRDADSTACPGKYLYARIPDIRELAAAAQKGWAGRELESNLAASDHPDLVVRRASDGQAFVIPTGGLIGFRAPVAAPGVLTGFDGGIATPDVTGDGLGDLLVRDPSGAVRVRPGTGTGFGDPVKTTQRFAGRDLVTPVGDLNGDGRNDVVARNTTTGGVNAYLGGGAGGFERKRTNLTATAYDALAATGDVTGDGFVDLFARDGDGVFWLLPGTGTRQFGAPVKVSGGWAKYTDISGFGDYTGDGVGDLVVRTDTGLGWVLPSRGDGTFGKAFGPINKTVAGSALSGADLTGDGVPDLVLRRGDGVDVLVNNGTYDTGAPIATGLDLASATALLNAGDWDRDGFGDIITRSPVGNLLLRRGDGTGRFAAPVKLATGFGKVKLLAAVGDMTGDGWPDLMGQPGGGSMRIYPGNGLDGLRASYPAHSPITAGRQVAIGRWDTDGAPDSLFRNGDRLTLFPGNGPGGLTSPKALGLDVAKYDWVVGVSDVLLNGHADVIVREKATGDLYLIQGTAKGFGKRRFIGEGAGVYDLVG